MKKNVKSQTSAPEIFTTTHVSNSISVTDLNNQIKNYIASTYKTLELYVHGEISNYKTFNNTIYFTLKDDSANISCCIWSTTGNKNIIPFKNGDQVSVVGKLTVYVKSGQYQLTVSKVSNIGIGNLYENFEKLKTHYKNIGYFDRPKRHLHPYIDNICVLTAASGAALQDFLSVLKKNNYTGSVTIKNVVVQGNDCAKSVSRALALVKQMDFDVIVLTRGGGSFEDLNGFNNAEIIEELNKIHTITISAIGHEIDTVLTDYVADIRAATPTMAAEMITSNLIKPEYYDFILSNYKSELLSRITNYEQIIKNAKYSIQDDNVLIEKQFIHLNKIKDSVDLLFKRKIDEYSNKIEKLKNLFGTLDINNTLNNYALIVDKNGNKVTSKKIYRKNIKNKIKMKIIFSDGNILIN